MHWSKVGPGIAATLAEADGCVFWCPKCEASQEPGRHAVKLWFLGVPAEAAPRIGRWRKGGTDEHDFSLLPNPQPNGEDGRSVSIPSPCGAHFTITDGIMEMLP